MNYWRGTGFFVGEEGEDPEYIVTNSHVVEEFILAGKALGGGTLHVLFDQDDEAEAYLVDYDYEKDIAVLKLEEPTDKRSSLQLREVEDGMLGDEVYAVGYPLAADMTVQAVDSFSTDDATVTAGSIGRLLTESGTGRRLIQTDTAMSGGKLRRTLIDGNGAVLGINTAAIQPGPESVLRRQRGGAAAHAGSEQHRLHPLQRLRRLREHRPLHRHRRGGGPGDRGAGSGPGAEEKGPAAEAKAAESPAGSPVLRSLSPQHGGLVVQLHHQQPVQIGRDSATCRLVYQDGTPGVSSHHCQVYYDEREKVFVVTDLNSTYGTFLAGGQRLQPNAPTKLPPRSSFYLGEVDNTVYVDLE